MDFELNLNIWIWI